MRLVYLWDLAALPLIQLEDAQKNNTVIIENLGIDSNLSNAIINNYALLETEIKEDGSDGEENNIGVVSTYQQQYRGIPLEDNFLQCVQIQMVCFL